MLSDFCPPFIESTTAQCVARGAALLDVENPGWYRRINTDGLDMRSSNACILGQLYGGDWTAGLRNLFGGRIETLSYAVAYGFDTPSGDSRAMWCNAIAERLQANTEREPIHA